MNSGEFVPKPIPNPIEQIRDTLKVAGSRMPLGLIVDRFRNGASPEEIHLAFPSLSLETIYRTLAAYLHDQHVIDPILLREADEEEKLVGDAVSEQRANGFRETLIARLEQKRSA